MNPKKNYYKTIADTVIKNLTKRKIEGYYVNNKEEALEKALSLISSNDIISFGGSVTLEEIGLLNALEKSNYQVLDRRKAKNEEETASIYRQVFSSDVYFMSSNAITLDGELINIDGNGNRVSALIFGPKSVILIAGMNKLSSNIDEGILRVHNFASPPNTLRLNFNTPCNKTGQCHQCLSDECICCQTVITRMSRIPNRIKVILVGEELGY